MGDTVTTNVNMAIDYLHGLEWVDGKCAWCGNPKEKGHKKGCKYNNMLNQINKDKEK